jgi:hypothetical protein
MKETTEGPAFACRVGVEDREQLNRIIQAIDEILRESEQIRGRADDLLRNRPVWPERRHPKHWGHPSGSNSDTNRQE